LICDVFAVAELLVFKDLVQLSVEGTVTISASIRQFVPSSQYVCGQAHIHSTYFFPSVLWRCWLGDRKGIRSVKTWLLLCSRWLFDCSFGRPTAPVVTTTSISISFNITS